MSSIRQQKIEAVIQSELATFFQRQSGEICLGAMVSVTVVRVTSDLSLARVYLSIFAGPDKNVVIENIQANRGKIRLEVGKRLKNLRKIPDLVFHIDDSLDYANKIDELLKN
jgi:ribosome-binding factor A